MYRYKRLVVGLSYSSADDLLVHYASLVSRMAHSSHVHFMHVMPTTPVGTDLYPEVTPTLGNTKARLREDLSTLIDHTFEGPSHADVRCELVEGTPLVELLRAAKEGDADLVIAGQDRQGGTLAEKLARKAPCSVLILPHEARPTIRRILVPVDFSDHAADALDVAAAFAEASSLDELHLLHVYDVPTAYLKLGQDYEAFRASLRERAEERFCTFINRQDILRGLNVVPHFVESGDVPKAICKEADTLDADLIVVGTRGRTASAAVLMGSVAEKMVRHANVPLVAVKRKGATLSLLEALFGL